MSLTIVTNSLGHSSFADLIQRFDKAEANFKDQGARAVNQANQMRINRLIRDQKTFMATVVKQMKTAFDFSKLEIKASDILISAGSANRIMSIWDAASESGDADKADEFVALCRDERDKVNTLVNGTWRPIRDRYLETVTSLSETLETLNQFEKFERESADVTGLPHLRLTAGDFYLLDPSGFTKIDNLISRLEDAVSDLEAPKGMVELLRRLQLLGITLQEFDALDPGFRDWLKSNGFNEKLRVRFGMR